MIYDGTFAHENDDTSADRLALVNQQFNELNDDAKYVGYMYGPVNNTEDTTAASISKVQAQTNIVSSDIKMKLEEWFQKNLNTYDNQIADSIFCYDRTTPGPGATGLWCDTGLGYGTNSTAYGVNGRFTTFYNDALVSKSSLQPKFTCDNRNDKFTKYDIEKGNGNLNEKIGLISADEIMAAGSGKYNKKSSYYYLNKGKKYWSGLPYDYASFPFECIVDTDGNLYDRHVSATDVGIAPVISLTPEYASQMIGDGTIGNEYRVE